MPLFTGEELFKLVKEYGSFPENSGVCAFPDIEEISTDSRKKSTSSLFIALDGENFDAHDFIASAVENGSVLVCADIRKKEKVPARVPAFFVESPLKFYQYLANCYRKRFKDLFLIALTGSCGKTSTKEALRAIFSEYAGSDRVLATEGNTNNQIGVPQNLFRLTEKHAFAIIEMGTNHFGEILPLAETALPDASLVVSIGSCHLEFLKNFEGVATEKGEIFSLLKKDAPCVIPSNCPAVEILREKAAARTENIYTFGENDPSVSVSFTYLGGDMDGSKFLLDFQGRKETVHWALSGKHQAQNAAAAAAMAFACKVPPEVIKRGLANTVLPGMRMKKSVYNGASFLNDSYNANPDSMRASLAFLADFAPKDKTVLVLGDMGEIGENSLREHMKVLSYADDLFPASKIICVGRMMRQAYDVFSLLSRNENMISCADVEEARPYVLAEAKEGVLLFLKASNFMKFYKLDPSSGA